MANNSPSSSVFHSTVLQSLETIQVSLNNLQVEQETCNRRVERLERKNQINPFESERQEIPLVDSGRSGIGPGLSPSTVQAGTEPNNYQREFECIRDSLNKVKLPNEFKLLRVKDWYKEGRSVHVHFNNQISPIHRDMFEVIGEF